MKNLAVDVYCWDEETGFYVQCVFFRKLASWKQYLDHQLDLFPENISL